MSDKIRIAIVDDHALFRAGVAKILSSEANFCIVGEEESLAGACDIVRELTPDILLLDIHMDGCGLDALPDIGRISPSTRVIMLTASEDTDKVRRAYSAGACGYILKGIDIHEFVLAVHTVMAGNTYTSPALASKLVLHFESGLRAAAADFEQLLSDREVEVLKIALTGKTNKEIARDLSISDKTVKAHMTNVMRKLGVRNRVEAVLYYSRAAKSGHSMLI